MQIPEVDVEAGDLDRRGRGVAWRVWSRRNARIMRIPTDKEFAYFLNLEFDVGAARVIEQPSFQVRLPAEPERSVSLGSFYVERSLGKREIHILASIASHRNEEPVKAWLQEHGFHLVDVSEDASWDGITRRRNLTKLLALVTGIEPAVDLCAEALAKLLKPKQSIQLGTLFDAAKRAGHVRHIGARAIAVLVHRGVLKLDLDGEIISAGSIAEVAEA